VGVHHERGRGGRRVRHRVDDGRRQGRGIRPPRGQQHPQIVALLVLLLMVVLVLFGRLLGRFLDSPAGRGASLTRDCNAYGDTGH